MAYSIAVLVKQTPDLNAVRVDKASGKPLLGDQLVMSSADAIAVEAALQLKEAHGGEITVVSAGPPSVKDVLQRALAMGADRGVLIPVDAPNALDTLAMAKVIADNQRGKGDTGSPEVQIALLTARINGLTDHFKSNVKDHHSRRGLLRMVSRRRKLLDYLKARNADTYRTLIDKLADFVREYRTGSDRAWIKSFRRWVREAVVPREEG